MLSSSVTLHRVAKKADTIFTMLPSTPQVKDVYLGDSGILQALNSLSSSFAPESIPPLFVDSTTLDVHFAREVATKIMEAGGQMIDAPVSGGPVGVRAGTLTFMAGGPNEAFELFASLSEYDGDQGGTLWPIRDWPCYEAMQQSYPGQSIGGLVLLGASHFGAYHPSFGQCRELIRWPSPKGCYWVFLWDWHRNFWLRLSTAPQVTSWPYLLSITSHAIYRC